MSSNGNTSIGLNCPIPSRFEQSEDWSQLADSYSQTPGGTLFSTTPGGVTAPALNPLGKLKEMDENKDLSADDAQFVIDI